ncbi:MAG TPA: archaemetzincin [candidate division Zixibacteria bacterium]|nr:archaemetzincin [candidate division Zixibacteria bacterium]
MKAIQLLPIGAPHRPLLEWLCSELGAAFHMPCEILSPALQPNATFHPERQQYHSSELLARMQSHVKWNTWRILGVTQVDLYVPILTFVFGEAQMGGKCSLVSYHRLRQEYYGLPPDMNLLSRRLLIESVHELGHTFELTHCDDYSCVMASSHAVEWIDIKEYTFCASCASRAEAVLKL